MIRHVFNAIVFGCFGISLFAQNNTLAFDTHATNSTDEIILSRNPGAGIYNAVIEGGAAIPGGPNLPSPTGYFEIHGFSDVSFRAKPPITTGRLYAEVQAPSTVGVAFSNPGASAVLLSFFFTDPSGRDFGFGTATIPPHGQLARFLDQPPFNAVAGLRGTMTFNASSPIVTIAVLGLVTNAGGFLMPQDIVVEIPNIGHTIIPYFISSTAPGQMTDVVLLNTTDDSISGTFTFFDRGTTSLDAQPVNVTLDGQIASVFSYLIPPRSSRRYVMSAGSANVISGSIQISPDMSTAAPAALAVIGQRDAIPGQRPGKALRVLADGFTQAFGAIREQTFFAIANPSPFPVTVALILDPVSSQSRTVTVPANGQVYDSTQDALGLTLPWGYRGSLRFLADSPISVIAFHNFPMLGSSTFIREPFDEAVPNAATVLPHLPSGLQGYSTHIRIFRTANDQATQGVIRFFSQAGDPVDPKTLLQ